MQRTAGLVAPRSEARARAGRAVRLLVLIVLAAAGSACGGDDPDAGLGDADGGRAVDAEGRGGGDTAGRRPGSGDVGSTEASASPGSDGRDSSIDRPTLSGGEGDAAAGTLDAPEGYGGGGPDAAGGGADAHSSTALLVTGKPGSLVRRYCEEVQFCPPDLKFCASVCLSATVAVGCRQPGCSPCDVPRAEAVCGSDGQCAIGKCHPGWADCDGDPKNGCEANLSAPESCAACGARCAAGQFCTPQGCSASCGPPLTACTTKPQVCADIGASPSNCGACGTTCGFLNSPKSAPMGCELGSCQYRCAAGYTRCPNESSCTDLRTDGKNCGACGTACGVAGPNEVVSCRNGACDRRCMPGAETCRGGCVFTRVDRNHCGRCGNGCLPDDLCSEGQCVPRALVWLANGVGTVSALEMDQSHLYWLDEPGGAVRKLAKSGGAVTVLAGGQRRPKFFTQDAAHLYWWNELDSAILRMPKDGSSAPKVAAAAQEVTGVGVAAGTLFWAAPVGTRTLGLFKAPADGGLATLIYSRVSQFDNPTDMRPTPVRVWDLGENIYVAETGGRISSARGLRLNARTGSMSLFTAGYYYWLSPSPNYVGIHGARGSYQDWIAWSPLEDNGRPGGALPQRILSGGRSEYDVWSGLPMFAMDDCAAYWGAQGSGLAISPLLDGNRNPFILLQDTAKPTFIVTDDTHIFWADQSGAIGKVPIP